MKHHVDFFRNHLIAPFGKTKLESVRLSDWINSPSANLTPPYSANYPIVLNSLSDLDRLFASEGSKFAAAAFESLETFRTRWTTAEDRDGMAWRFVGLYYSAFYAAHAVLRFLGKSLTNIPNWNGVQKEFDTLYKSASIPNLNLRGGYHCINLSNDKRSIEIDDAKASGSLGSHGVTWREFRKSADRAYSNNNLNTTGQRNAAADYAGLISKPINIDPDMPPIQWPWMSAMRNRINYRIPEDLWGASKKRISPNKMKIIHQLIYTPSPELIITYSSHNEGLVRFVSSCMYTLSILASLTKEMDQRALSKTLSPSFVSERSKLLNSF